MSLALIVFSGGFDRVHHALALATTAAALDRPVTLFFTGRALTALLPAAADGTPAWQRLDAADDGTSPAARDQRFAALGVARFEDLLEAAVALEVRFMACEMGLRALGLELSQPLRPDLPIVPGGMVALMVGEAAGGQLLFI